jgi:hypothetical protein
MITSRVSKRPGYGVNRGATNPKVTVSDTAPLNPRNRDLFLDTTTEALSRWDAGASPPDWVPVLAGVGGASTIYVQSSEPAEAVANDVWVDTDDYSRYDKTALTEAATLATSANEFITASGTFTVTLHAGTSAGIIKKIYNVGTGLVTIAGTINGVANMMLYPNESVELITDGTNWRY